MSEMKWCYSTNAETFQGKYDTRLQAIDAAMEALDGDLRPFDLGRCKPLDFEGIAKGIAEYELRDAVSCAISDLVGDAAEDAAGPSDFKVMERQITRVLQVWMAKRYGEFYEVVETESVTP